MKRDEPKFGEHIVVSLFGGPLDGETRSVQPGLQTETGTLTDSTAIACLEKEAPYIINGPIWTYRFDGKPTRDESGQWKVKAHWASQNNHP